jgi:hypothetical protein
MRFKIIAQLYQVRVVGELPESHFLANSFHVHQYISYHAGAS